MMGEALSPEEKHDIFTKWAKNHGVRINGVAPARFAGRGLGIAATRPIETGEELVKVPLSALLTTDSIPTPFRDLHGDISVHGLLTSFLAFGDPEDLSTYSPWIDTWPSPVDFAESMPIMWPKHELCPLPPSISGRWSTVNVHKPPTEESTSGLLPKQEAKFKKDWTKVSSVIPGADRGRYMYYWLIANTRTFYHELPGRKQKKKMAREDCMALCPFADYFNHADDEGVDGFILPTNKSDSLIIDHLILPHLSPHHKSLLEEAGYLGTYTLLPSGVCYRTQVALRTQTLSLEHWRLYVASGGVDLPAKVQERDERDAEEWLRTWVLGPWLREVKGALGRVRASGEKGWRGVVFRRWVQIGELLEGAKGALV
ncbi:hypothetical protein MMC16_006827 [Acarospora aff. strigata]|nr:hypothetical protein [Acarospora aff. strigata]